MANPDSIFYKLGEAVKAQIESANGASGAVQTELNTTQQAAGLEANGTYAADTTTNYINEAASLKAADKELDSQLKGARDEIDDTQTGAGLGTDGSYSPKTDANYISGAASLKNADELLDAEVKTLAEGKADLDGATFTGAVSGTSLSLSDSLTVSKDLSVTKNVTISGDLTVTGETTQTRITQTDLDIKDNLIGLNRGASDAANNTKDIGFYFERGSEDNAAAFMFDEDKAKFVVGFLEATPGTGSTLEILFANAEIGAAMATGDLKYSFNLTGDAAAVIEANPQIPVMGAGPNQGFNHNDGDMDLYGGVMAGDTVYLSLDIFATDDTGGTTPWTVETYLAYLAMTDEEKAQNYPGYTITPELYFSAGNSIVFNSANDSVTGFKVSSSLTGVAKADPFVVGSIPFDTYASQMMVTTSPTASHSGGPGTPAADASAATAEANAAPLVVGSLEIGSAVLGDLADFEAGLADS